MTNRRGIHETTRPDLYIAATADATGVAQGAIGPCPEGYEWYVERMTVSQSGAAVAAAATVEVFVVATDRLTGTTSKQGRQDYAAGATNVAGSVSDAASPIVIPAGFFLVCYWTGLTAADKVQLSTQIEIRRLVLEKAQHGRGTMRPEHESDPKAGDLHGTPVVVGDQVAAV